MFIFLRISNGTSCRWIIDKFRKSSRKIVHLINLSSRRTKTGYQIDCCYCVMLQAIAFHFVWLLPPSRTPKMTFMNISAIYTALYSFTKDTISQDALWQMLSRPMQLLTLAGWTFFFGKERSTLIVKRLDIT